MKETLTGKVEVEVREPYVQRFEEPRQALTTVAAWSWVRASVAFRVGDVDVVRLIQGTSDDVNLRAWVQRTWQLLWDLRGPGRRHVFFEGEADRWVEFHHHDAGVSIQTERGVVAVCDHGDLVSAIEAMHASVRTELEACGEGGQCWWQDAYDVLDPGWIDLDDDAFFASRQSWRVGGPFFYAKLASPDLGAVEQALASLRTCERWPPVKTGEPSSSRWVWEVAGLERRAGFYFLSADGSIAFPGRQVARACQLPNEEADALWPTGPCPTPQARSFLRGLVALVQQLAGATTITSAALYEEGTAGPRCVVEPGWVYVYAWAEVGGPTTDRHFHRVSL